jgi:hypothetical protein
LASDGVNEASFGNSLAIEDTTVLIGASGDDDNGIHSGSVYVFTRDGSGSWTQQAKLTAGDGAPYDYFGNALGIDGDTAVIGAMGDDYNEMPSGSAYVFTRDGGGSWSQQAKLTASDGAAEDWFGLSVTVNGDTALIGAPFDDDNGSFSGSAYVFTRDGGSWSEQAKLTASDGAPYDYFGTAVAVEGPTAVIGSYGDDSNTGSAYVFSYDGSGGWTEQVKLAASDGAPYDLLGIAVALDSDTVVVGAPFDDDNGADSGSAYVFHVDLATFYDVPITHWAFDYIEALAESGITGGCGGGNFCPEDPVTRAHMAVWLERGMNGSGFDPPPATGTYFLDVSVDYWAAAWIEQLYRDGITSGCGGGNYCPASSVIRAQMAVFLLRAKHGAGYTPPPPSGLFDDVGLDHWAVAWIEQLAREGITSGCGGGNYCPEAKVTRAQMAVFLVRTFGL